MLIDRTMPKVRARPTDADADQLVALMASVRPAVQSVPALAEMSGLTRDRVADALAVAVEDGRLDEWPEHPSGPAVMLAHPERHGLRLEVAGEADALTWAWVAIDDDPREPRWRADRDKRRRATRTMTEGAARSSGWENPLSVTPDPRAFDPAMIVEHAEELERAMAAHTVTERAIRPLLPATPFGPAHLEPGRPHHRHEPADQRERDAWALLGHGAAWTPHWPMPEPRRDVPADARPVPITTARPDNLRPAGVPSGCPHCKGRTLNAAEYCLYCDASGIDRVVAQPIERLEAIAAREVGKIDKHRAAYEAAAAGKRAARRIRDAKRREEKEREAMVAV